MNLHYSNVIHRLPSIECHDVRSAWTQRRFNVNGRPDSSASFEIHALHVDIRIRIYLFVFFLHLLLSRRHQ